MIAVQRLAFRGHSFGFIGGCNALEKQALVGLARHNRGAAHTACDGQRRRVQPQFAFLLEGAMAGVAALGEHRLDVRQVADAFGESTPVDQQAYGDNYRSQSGKRETRADTVVTTRP